MGYRTVTVDVDVYIDDVIDEMRDQDLIDILEGRGYTVTKDVELQTFERADWHMLLNLLDSQNPNWELRRVRDKIMDACFG